MWVRFPPTAQTFYFNNNIINMSKKLKEQELLEKLYESRDLMEELLDNGKNDGHYFMINVLIERLENYLKDENPLI
jgi:hypothetical protein